MADLNIKNSWMVAETNEVKKKWLACQIQEKKSRIARVKQDIDDILKGRVVELEGHVMMLELELKKLQDDYNRFDSTIDV